MSDFELKIYKSVCQYKAFFDFLSSDLKKGTGWMRIEGNLKYVSCGEYGCWGVNKQGNIYFRMGVSPTTPSGTQWAVIPGQLDMVESGPSGLTIGVSPDQKVMFRTGVSPQKPEGTQWANLDLDFAHVTVGRAGIIGILSDGTVAIYQG